MNWIVDLKNAPQSADNILSDGVFSVSYGDMQSYFEAFDGVFNAHHIETRDTLVLALENSVPAALTLLYVLQRQHSVLLIPTTPDTVELPLFCRYAIRCQSLAPDNPQALKPAHFLNISENPSWNGAAVSIGADLPKLLMRTSGSTGDPKIAVFTHEKLHGNILNCVQRFALNPGDRVALPVPLYHMYGLGAAFLPGVLTGASIDLQKGANLLKFLQRETAFNPNVAFMTPSFAGTLLQARKSARPYRLTVTAGDRFRDDYFARYEAAFGPLVQLYGSTELGAVAAASADLPLAVRQATAGLPMPDVAFRLHSKSEKGNEEGGELWCKRNYGFEAYVDRQGQTVDLGTDYADGWFRTKDFARLSPAGYLELLGRSDHCVNRDGLLVFFADLEKTIEALEHIESVTVVAGAEDKRGKALIAYCVPRKNSSLSAEKIRAHCFDTLPGYAVPDQIQLRETLPLLPNGKIDRMALQ